MRQNQGGFSALLLLILVFTFMALPAYYWFSQNQSNYEDDVKGVASVNGSTLTGATSAKSTPFNKPGFSVSIVSDSPTWDLVEYLCTNMDECLSNLNAGRRLGTVSGGETELHEVVVEYSSDWEEYDFVKYFVRSGVYPVGDMFRVVDIGDVPGSQVYEIEDGSEAYEVVVSPVDSVNDSFVNSATFSNL